MAIRNTLYAAVAHNNTHFVTCSLQYTTHNIHQFTSHNNQTVWQNTKKIQNTDAASRNTQSTWPDGRMQCAKHTGWGHTINTINTGPYAQALVTVDLSTICNFVSGLDRVH